MEQHNSAHEQLLAFLYQSPIALVQIATNGDVMMVTPRAAALLLPLARGCGLDNLFTALGQVAPELKRLTDDYTFDSGVVCDSLHIHVEAGCLRSTASVLALNILKNDPHSLMVLLTDVTEEVLKIRSAREAQHIAEQANRTKSEFLTRMNHELRTPLSAILGFAEVLLRNSEQSLAPKQRDQVTRIHSAGDHLLRLVNDLLDLSHIEMGMLQVTMGTIDPLPVIQNALHEVALLAEARTITIEPLQQSGGNAAVRADATRLKQVVLNLLTNAIKYNHEGGSVSPRITRQGTYWRISVSDTGIGMSPAQLAELFQPYNRLGREASSVEGVGIGLVITRQLVQMMGGDIVVNSAPDGGSEFTIELVADDHLSGQRANDDQSVPALPETTQLPECRGKKVLLVEDEAMMHELIEECLDMFGLLVDSAFTGMDAVALVKTTPYDLVLMDMQMPKMGGLEAARVIRQQPGYAKVPIVAMTGYAVDEVRESCLAAGMDDVLSKPINMRDMFSTIEYWLGVC